MFAQALWVLGSLLTCFSIAIDGARYLLQRHQVSHALLESVRLQSRAHMHPEHFAAQLQQTLQQLAVPQPLGWPHSWHAEQLRPNDEDFSLFRDHQLEQALSWSHPTINNHYLDAQHQHHQSSAERQSSVGGLPSVGGLSSTNPNIFAANSLKLVFYYAFEPLNPLVRAILKPLHGSVQHPFTQRLLAQGLLPLVFELTHPYASHPVAWPQHPELPYYRLQSTDKPTPEFTQADSQLKNPAATPAGPLELETGQNPASSAEASIDAGKAGLAHARPPDYGSGGNGDKVISPPPLHSDAPIEFCDHPGCSTCL